jgi:hypothetical protein
VTLNGWEILCGTVEDVKALVDYYIAKSDIPMPTFSVGDRVQRLMNVYDQSSQMRRGVVIERYRDLVSALGPYPELYAVRWDDGQIERGFLPHGLCREVENSIVPEVTPHAHT